MVLRILQGAGNFRDTLLLARHELVDGISADLWVRDGEAFIHHARRLGPLRYTVSRAGIRRYDRDRIPVEVVMSAAEGRLLILDVRTEGGDPAPEIARLVYPLHDRSRIVVACEDRALMDRLRAWQPDLPVAHALPTEGALRRYIQGRINSSLPSMPVIVPETLLHTRLELESLATHAASVGVRNVRTPARATELAAWGADLVMGASLEVLESVPAPTA
ncbi:MAG: hypothetical protein WC211_03370 [Dehalococcoidia bacterium]